MSTRVHPGHTGRRPARRPSRRAWIATAFIPVAFVVAMVLGEALLALQGYDSADAHIPWQVVASAGGTALLILEIPCVAAVVLGRRALAAGDPHGKAPALVGAVLGAVFLVQNLAGLLLD